MVTYISPRARKINALCKTHDDLLSAVANL